MCEFFSLKNTHNFVEIRPVKDIMLTDVFIEKAVGGCAKDCHDRIEGGIEEGGKDWFTGESVEVENECSH